MNTKTIDETLQKSYRESDQATVKVTLTVPLGLLRQQNTLFGQLQIESITMLDGAAAASEAAVTAKKSSKSAKRKTKAPTKTATGGAKKAPAKVTIEGVSAAITAGHTSPAAIAKVLGVSPKVVSTALGRYAKRDLVVRVQPGTYGLP